MSAYGTMPPSNNYNAGQNDLIYQDGEDPYRKQNPRLKVNGFELVLVPWLALVSVLVVYALGGEHGEFRLLCVVPVVLIVLFGVFTYHMWKAKRTMEVVLGLLAIVALFIATVVGVIAEVNMMHEYWRLGKGASYTNVLPEESALSRSDATTLTFAVGTIVDVSKTYGFVDGFTQGGSIYCVAPVMDAASDGGVNYWAAGENCCFPRQGFNCGQAQKPDVHGAIVLPLATQRNPFYSKAIAGAEVAYGLQSGTGAMLVEWIVDPVAYRSNLRSATLKLYFILAAVYFIISIMAACGVYWMMKSSAPA